MRLVGITIFLLSIFYTSHVCGQDYVLDIDSQLLVAAYEGDTLEMITLIRMGAGVNTGSYEQITPLMFAAQNGYTGAVRILLLNKAEVNLKDHNGFTALVYAIRNGYIETAEYLIRNGADYNLTDDEQVSPLMHAIEVDSFFMPDLLLYYGADTHHKDAEGRNALMIASKMGSFEIAVSLLETGVNVNTADVKGNTALHYASAAGKTDIMELLILNGATIDIKNNEGYTPLALTVALNNYNATKVLISHGADVNIPVNSSLKPLDLAYRNKNDSLTRMLINNNATELRRLNFNQYLFGFGYVFNSKDAQIKVLFGMNDSHYNIAVSLGYGLRPKSINVLENPDPEIYYQYRESRQFLSLSVSKGFLVQNLRPGLKAGAFIGVSEIFTFGSYRGSDNHPKPRLITNPGIGCVFEFGLLRMKFSYEFMNLHLNKYERGWFGISAEMLINKKNSKKGIPW